MAYHSGGNHDPYGPDAYAPAGDGRGRSGSGVPDGLIVGLLGLAVSITLLVWSSTGLAAWLRHGSWPAEVSFAGTAGAIRSLVGAPADVARAWPQADPAALPSASLLWLVFFAQLVVVFSGVLWVMIRVARWRGRRAAGGPPAPGPGAAHVRGNVPDGGGAPHGGAPYPGPYADAAAAAAADHGAPAGSGPPVPEPEADAGVGAGAGAPVTPVAAVLGAPGGAVVVDPDGTLYEKTARQRGRLGPVHVYDPGHTAEVPVRLRWAPHRGCEEMAEARGRAAAMLAPVRPREPVFQLDAEAAETLLRGFLHAAALNGAAFTHVHRWAQGRSAEAAKILRGHNRAAPGASMELEAALTSHPGRRDAALRLIERALAGLDQLHIRQSCTPGRVDALALDNLAGEDGTLYVIGHSDATEPFRHALLTALAADHRVTRVG